jgi:dipeptidyl aminopeptidase/acylaminoacyl peptidase
MSNYPTIVDLHGAEMSIYSLRERWNVRFLAERMWIVHVLAESRARKTYRQDLVTELKKSPYLKV